jgi:hypothetical protein
VQGIIEGDSIHKNEWLQTLAKGKAYDADDKLSPGK